METDNYSFKQSSRTEHLFQERIFFYIVNDAERGRVEVAVDSGDVEICVGHKIINDDCGKRYAALHIKRFF